MNNVNVFYVLVSALKDIMGYQYRNSDPQAGTLITGLISFNYLKLNKLIKSSIRTYK